MAEQMNPVIKARWVEALRSGLYKQGVGQLHNTQTNQWCCLGVLCDLATTEGVVSERLGAKDGLFFPIDNPDQGSDALLPQAVQDWAGLKVSSPYFGTEDPFEAAHNKTYLSGMNDGGASFQMIADILDQHF